MAEAASKTGSRGLRMMIRLLGLLIIGNIAFTAYVWNKLSTHGEGQTRIAFVTASDAPYWELAIQGASDAADEYDVELDVYRPTKGPEEQSIILRGLSHSNVDGIAVSPAQPDDQASLLNHIAGSKKLVTIDSDAPGTRRHFFVGTNNYAAGYRAGTLVKEAKPDGAKVLVTIGTTVQFNGRQRWQGVVDALLGRPPQAGQDVEISLGPQADGKYSIVATATDAGDRALAKPLVTEALAKHPEIDCIVGIYAYHAPAAIQALRDAKRKGVTIIGFDDYEATLAGVESGEVYAALAQDPYHFGYTAVRSLVGLHKGSAAAPVSESMLFSCAVITKGNVTTYREKVKKTKTVAAK